MIRVINLSSTIRDNINAKLSKEISLDGMHNSLTNLFIDRTKIDTSLRRLMNDDLIRLNLIYSDCMSLNDESKIKFNKSLPMNERVNKEHDMFIPKG